MQGILDPKKKYEGTTLCIIGPIVPKLRVLADAMPMTDRSIVCGPSADLPDFWLLT